MTTDLTTNLLVVIQARFASTRLPNKVLKKIGGLSMLEHVRARAERLGPVVVALPFPDIPEEDVLSRFWRVAEQHPGVDTFVRLTADCPLLDVGLSRQIIDTFFREAGVIDIVGTAPELDGLDTEVFSRRALEITNVHDHDEREHVTRWMRRALNTHTVFLPGQGPFRWSVDDQEGLDFVRRVMGACRLCYDGVPHHSNAASSIGGSEGRAPRWDLHAVPDGGLAECTAYDIRMERVGGPVYRSR